MLLLRKAAPASWKWLLMGLSLALVLLLLAIACGGGEEEARPATVETPTVEAPAGGTPAGETPTLQTPAAVEEGATELQELAQASEAITAKVTYRIRSTVEGEEMEGTWTLVQRPPDTRIDFTAAEEEEAFSVIEAGGKSYLCIQTEGEGQCLSVPVEQAEEQTALLEPFFETTESLAEEDIEAFNLVETSERTIAGVRAKCFKVRGTELTGFGEAEVCFSEDGILLLSRSSFAGGQSSVEATEVTTVVTDADFEPPYPVTEFE